MQHGEGEHVWIGASVDLSHHQRTNRYSGEWQQGVRHGRGTMYYANGAEFTGTWVRGKRVRVVCVSLVLSAVVGRCW